MFCLNVDPLVGPILFVPPVQSVVTLPNANVSVLIGALGAFLAATLELLLGIEIDIVQKFLYIGQLPPAFLLAQPQLLYLLLLATCTSFLLEITVAVNKTSIFPCLRILHITLTAVVSSSLCLLIVVRMCLRCNCACDS